MNSYSLSGFHSYLDEEESRDFLFFIFSSVFFFHFGERKLKVLSLALLIIFRLGSAVKIMHFASRASGLSAGCDHVTGFLV